MLTEQYKTLMSKINAALSEPLTRVDQTVYEESKNIITAFYNSHTETEPVVEERDSLVRELEILGDKDARCIVTTCTVIIWVIEVYGIGDQLEKEYIYKRRSCLYKNVNVEGYRPTGPDGPDY